MDTQDRPLHSNLKPVLINMLKNDANLSKPQLIVLDTIRNTISYLSAGISTSDGFESNPRYAAIVCWVVSHLDVIFLSHKI